MSIKIVAYYVVPDRRVASWNLRELTPSRLELQQGGTVGPKCASVVPRDRSPRVLFR